MHPCVLSTPVVSDHFRDPSSFFARGGSKGAVPLLSRKCWITTSGSHLEVGLLYDLLYALRFSVLSVYQVSLMFYIAASANSDTCQFVFSIRIIRVCHSTLVRKGNRSWSLLKQTVVVEKIFENERRLPLGAGCPGGRK